MNRMDELVSAEHRQLIERLLEVRRPDGSLVTSADDTALAILKTLVTEEGRLSPSIAADLGGDPPFGRGKLVPALICALVGSQPVAEAWIVAAANGFERADPVTYGAAGKSKGTPGVYLQRMLADYRTTANTLGTSSPPASAKRAELGILIVTMLVEQLKRAVNARMALGPAWAVMMAVDRLSRKHQRRIDALADDQTFRHALGQAIAGVVADFTTTPALERTNAAMATSLPAGSAVDRFFADRYIATIELINEAIVSAQAGIAPDDVARALQTIADDAMDRAVDENIAMGCAYLRHDWTGVPASERDEHLRRLAFVMPSLAPEVGPLHRARRALSLSPSLRSNARFIGAERADMVYLGVVNTIIHYAREKGPPPPDTPLDHLIFFEGAACYYSLQPSSAWPAREMWGELGTMATLPDFDLAEWTKALSLQGLAAIP